MRIPLRVTKSVVAMVVAAGALVAPAATNPASALPPCCGVNYITNYYATADMSGSKVGQFDQDDCEFTSWGVRTAYYKITKQYCSTQ